MWKGFKKGLGFAFGYFIGHGIMNCIANKTLKSLAKDEVYLEGLKDRDPSGYEFLKKYRPKKKESVEEEESQ